MPKLQSAYRRHHSTETAVLPVLSDILTAMDNQQVTLLAWVQPSMMSIITSYCQGCSPVSAWEVYPDLDLVISDWQIPAYLVQWEPLDRNYALVWRSTRICFRTPSVFAVCSTDLWHHCIIQTVRLPLHLCWWFPGVVHHCDAIHIADGCSRVGCMCQRSRSMDGVLQTEIECQENSANLDRNWATASQADRHSTPADKLSCWVWQYGHELQRGSWQSAVHVSANWCFYQLRQLKSVKSSLSREALYSHMQPMFYIPHFTPTCSFSVSQRPQIHGWLVDYTMVFWYILFSYIVYVFPYF